LTIGVFPQVLSAAPSSIQLGQFKQRQQEHSLAVCCAWGNKLADGILTYKIKDNGNTAAEQAIHNAIEEWNSKIDGIKLVEDSGHTNKNADIEIRLNSNALKIKASGINKNGDIYPGAKKVTLTIPGITNIKYDSRGFITNVLVTISTTDSSDNRVSSFDSSRIEAIAKHEMGHVLGIGHSNFIGDLMSPILTRKTKDNISECDVNAVLQANKWKLADSNNNNPHVPSQDYVGC
jgi:hypothetical protein